MKRFHIIARATYGTENITDDFIVEAESKEDALKDWHDFNVQADQKIILRLEEVQNGRDS